jgi:homoserine dehydrogenase
VARLLQTRHSRFVLTTIFNRQVARKRVDWIAPSVRWTDHIDDALDSADIVVEVVGGVEPAGRWVRAAIAAGKPVVTANKQLIAECGDELVELARTHGVALRFEASVGGGIPIVRGIEDGLAGDRLVSLAGIVNGTCNYILTRMDEGGASFGDALAEAQRLGFAEADPTADIEGYDARAKLVVLARLALDVSLDPASVPCRSIANVSAVDFDLAREAGGTIRQVSSLERHPADDEAAPTAWVSPAFVPLDSLFARLSGAQNVVITRGEFGGETTFVGNGAGGDPTAVAVVSDVIAVADGALPPQAASGGRREATRDFGARRYLRIAFPDRPVPCEVVMAGLANHGLLVEATLETEADAGKTLAFMLAPTRMAPIDEALTDLQLDAGSLAVLALPVIESKRARPFVEAAGVGAATGVSLRSE